MQSLQEEKEREREERYNMAYASYINIAGESEIEPLSDEDETEIKVDDWYRHTNWGQGIETNFYVRE